MRKYIIVLSCLLCMPMLTRGQTTIDDPVLTELLQPKYAQVLYYWFDEDDGNMQTVSGLSGVKTIDVSVLADGLHTVHYLLKATDGSVCHSSAAVFVKMEEVLNDVTSTITVNPKSIVYWFDDDIAGKHVSNSLSGTYTLDVSTLADGLHLVHYYVLGEDDKPYGLTSGMFLKDAEQHVEPGPNKIIGYSYWLNGEFVQTVSLEQPANPYTLMSLLPLQTKPIRSSVFHFQVDDGVPTIYAKNTFNIRFYDSQGYFVDNLFENEKTFIDYSVSQPVVPVGELEASQSFARMSDNEIRWYTVSLERGDSVEFKTDKACSIQLFSPSGDEVYKASGAESVRWDGCHAWESGTFYLALHDVTATSGNTITLDYNHIDKYAVLRQNVKVVGNGGYTTISFDGNGFKDLYAIDLLDAEQNTIECISLGIENNTQISPTFDFTNVKLGVYDAHFHFTEGNVVVKDAITVVEATDITINAKLETPSILVGVGKPYFDVTIVCPNDGNNTAYGVPLEVSLTAPKGSISRIDITNPEVPTLAELLYSDELSDEDWLEIQQISDQLGDTYDFITKEWVDEETGEEMVTMMIYLATTIAPESTNAIKLQVLASSDVKTEVDCPLDWMPIYNIEKKDYSSQRPENCDGLEKLKCAIDKIATNVGVISTIGSLTPAYAVTGLADCITSTASSLCGAYVMLHCGGPRETFEPTFFKTIQKTSALWSPAVSCALAFVPAGKIAKETAAAITATTTTMSYVNSIEDCENAFGDKIEGLSQRTYSLDPNDIYGYLSPSGSKYINKEQKELFYTIEFENDPTLATAPAHDIYLTNTLDASLFDLSTFKPTKVNLGGKTAELTGDKNFVTTMDLRPELNVIAQIEGSFDETTGVAHWHISSLDPMTMEPTVDVFDGVLPINTDGSGVGELFYDISLKDNLEHGTEIPNRATIVFDANEPIVTPTWTNVIDAISPTSHIVDVTQSDGGMAEVTIEATDELSGTWRYDVYVQYGTGSAWMKMTENVPVGTKAKVKVYGGINHGFYSVVTDQAGNKEVKEPIREMTLDIPILLGDANGDGSVTISDAVAIVNKILGNPSGNFNATAANVSGDVDEHGDPIISITDAVGVVNIILGNGGGSSAPKMDMKEPEPLAD